MRKLNFSFKSLLVAAGLLLGSANAWGVANFMTTWTGFVGTDNTKDLTYGTKKVRIAAGETYVYTITNLNDGGSDTWHNWVVEGNCGDKYFDCCANGDKWGAGGGPTPDYTSVIETSDVDGWMGKYNGATVTITIARDAAGTGITVTHTSNVLGTTDGNTDKHYGGTYTVTVGAEEEWDIYITQRYSHFEVSNVVYTESDGTTTHTYGSAIEALPFSKTWTSANNNKYPFDNGAIKSGTSVTAFQVNNTTATAWFNTDGNGAAYGLEANEEVTVSFTAYHGWANGGPNQGVKLINSEGNIIAEYIYNLGGANLTAVNIGGSSATGWNEAYNCQSKYSDSKNANGFTINPYTTTSGDNPLFTFKIQSNGKVSVNVYFPNNRTASINNTYTGTLPDGWAADIQKIQIYSGNDNASGDRTIAINNLNITSKILTAPTISVSSPSSYAKKGSTHTLTADVDGDLSPTIQWYSNTTNSTEGGAEIDGATNATYTPSTASNGTTYYYAIATNEIGATVSNIIPVIVAEYQTEFSADATVSISIATTTSDVDLSDKVTISGGVIYATNNHASNSQSMITSPTTGVTCFGLNTNAAFFKVKLDKPLEAGDIISAEIGKDGARGIRIYNTYTSSTSLPSGTDYVTISITESGFHNASYTLTSDDVFLIGRTIIYIYRNTAEGTYFDNLTISRPNVVSGVIGATGWSSFASPYKLDLSGIEGATAYYASASDASNVTLTSTGAIVSADEGLMLKGTAGETFTISKTDETVTFNGTNLLVGCAEATDITSEMATNTIWVLASNAGNAEFQYLTSALTIPAGKAYLPIAKTPGAKALRIVFDDGEATGIAAPEVAEKAENGVLYNLNGQQVTADYKGIVIKNGKKYFNK